MRDGAIILSLVIIVLLNAVFLAEPRLFINPELLTGNAIGAQQDDIVSALNIKGVMPKDAWLNKTNDPINATECVKNWVCTDWQPTECNPWDTKQTRTCLNTYNEACPAKPTEERPCTAPECNNGIKDEDEDDIDCGGPCKQCNKLGTGLAVKETNSTQTNKNKQITNTVIIIALATSLIGGALFVASKVWSAKSEKATDTGIETDPELEEARSLLKQPIEDAIKSGYTKKEIVEMLEKNDWDTKIVERVLEDYDIHDKPNLTLSTYIKKSLTQGKNPAQIKSVLIKHGWPEKTVDAEIKRATQHL